MVKRVQILHSRDISVVQKTVNNELTGLTRLPLFRDMTSLWPLEFSSNKDIFQRFTFPVGDERRLSEYLSLQIDWFSIALHLYN